MASLVEDRMSVARAAIASSIAARTGMRFAGTSTDGGNNPTYLTLCSTPPAGYHMEIELTPLELIMRGVEGLRDGEQEESREITTADHLLEETNAFVHDRLLNPALPFQPLSPGLTDTASINTIYGETLRRATFAGGTTASSSRFEDANRLLFSDGIPTEALEAYRSYEDRVREARAELRDVTSSGDDASRDLARQRLQRLEAEWIGIGRKREIEDAFRIIQEESEAAGFEDERLALLERFRSGEEKRIDLPAMTYHRVQIVPLAPLFSEEAGGFWQRIDLDAPGVAGALTEEARSALGIADDQVTRAVDRLENLTIEFLVCDLVRDWIDPDFFTKRFWRLAHGETPLSDGSGGGRLPALPTNVVFIRNASVEYEGDWTAHPGTLAEVSRDAPMRSTLQIAAELRPGVTAKSGTIKEAARRRGLTSSIKMLDAEAKRISSTAIRSAVATAPPSPARQRARENGGNVGLAVQPGLIGTVAGNIRLTSERPVTRVPARRGKVRDRRDPNRPVTRVPARRGQVRDHRDPNRPKPPTTLTVDGTIAVSDDQKSVLDGISLHYAGEHSPDREEPIRLSRSSPTSMTFRHRFTTRDRASNRPQRRFEIVLRDADGDELDRRFVEIGDDPDITLDWVVRAERVVIELAGQYTPTLHAWGLRPLPPCPDPDETLEWP